MKVFDRHTFYQTRFEVHPSSSSVVASPQVLAILARWVMQKERSHHLFGVRKALETEQVDLHDLYPEEVPSACVVPKAFLEDVRIPLGYDGQCESWHKAGQSHTGFRCTSLRLSGDGVMPSQWAMAYDEPDGRVLYRRWHTSVGITTHEGACVVNVQIENYLTQEPMGPYPEQPLRNTPRFVKHILGMGGCWVRMGGVELAVSPNFLDSRRKFADFKKVLLEPSRGLSLVLVATDESGRYPVSPAALSSMLVGVANVYCVNTADDKSAQRMASLFQWDTPAYWYGCGPGCVRVYKPGVDLGDSRARGRHPYYVLQTNEQRERYADLPEYLSRWLTIAYDREEDEVLYVADVEALKRRIERSGREARVRELLDAAGASDVAELVDDLRSAEQLIDEYAESELQMDDRVKRLEAELHRAQRQRDDAEAERDNLQRELEDWQRGAAGVPDTLESILDHAARAFPGRVVLTDETRRSAGRCRQGTPEEWREIAASLPAVLWKLHRETNDRATLEMRYKERTGYGLALRESGTTKDDPKFTRIRTVEFDGCEYVTWPHVKGKGRGDHAFRLYYAWDANRDLLVLGHCGHLDNAKTMHRH